jgi:hypothetical protein
MRVVISSFIFYLPIMLIRFATANTFFHHINYCFRSWRFISCVTKIVIFVYIGVNLVIIILLADLFVHVQ